MKRLILSLLVASLFCVTAQAADAPTNTTPPWKSYMATGNAADIVASTTVAAAIGTKVDATSGQSLNQTLQTPTITGGSASGIILTNPTISGGTVTNIDISSATAIPLNGSQKETITSISGRILSVQDFGAKCDGSTDDTAAFKAAYTKLNALGGGVINLPWGGNCHIKGALKATTPIVIEGGGKYNSYITQDENSVDTLVWEGSFYGGGARDFSIAYSNHSNTAGSGISVVNASDFVASNINISYPYNGVSETSAGVVRLEGIDISRAVNDSFLINGGALQYLTNVSSYNDDDSPSHAGIEILSTGATHIVNSGMSGQGVSVLIDPSGTVVQHSGWAEAQAFDIWISNSDLDDAKTSGLQISPGNGGTVHSVQVVGSRVGVARGAGIVIGNSDPSVTGVVEDILFSGDLITGSQQQGLLVYSGTDISLDGTQFLGNAILGGTYAGIDLEGGGRITFNGVTSGKWRDLAATQSYGLELGGYFSGSVKFTGGNLDNNISGPYVNYSTSSPSFSIQNTIGVNPVGIKLPPVSASPFTYTAGPTHETMMVEGGDVSSIAIGSTTVATSTGASIPLNPGQSVTVTYTTAPKVIINGQ